MKKLIITSILAAMIAAITPAAAQDYPDEYLGLPGDNLNLYAVMDLFRQSETLEGFERNLNDEKSRINNLDLNGDNMIDYIMVTDYIDGRVHTIVLRVALNRREYQDVAVFTVQRYQNGSVQIQLIGDEALYGKNYIVEPIYADNYWETPNPGYEGRGGSRENITVIRTTAFEVAAWPLVRFIYMPDYIVWRSSWHWAYYPSYWHPWHPYYWHYYYGYHYQWYPRYYEHYRHWHQNRYTRFNDFYYSDIRSHSPYVSTRIKEGHYKSTYSHPEQRRDGEALYTKMYSGHSTGTSTRNNTVNQDLERRTISQYSQEKRESHGNSENAQRTISSGTDRHEAGNRKSISGRSPAVISDREASRPQKVVTARTTEHRQSTINTGSSARRGTGLSKTGTASAKNNNTAEPETEKTSRRR